MSSPKHIQTQKSSIHQSIQITQEIFNSFQIKSNSDIPIDSISNFFHSKIDFPQSKSCTVDQIMQICQLNYDSRLSLLQEILDFANQNKLSDSQNIYLSNIIFQSCCGLLFWDFKEIDQNSFAVFSNSLLYSISNLIQNNLFVIFFNLILYKIFKFPDIDNSIHSLPLISKIIDKYPQLVKYSLKGIVNFLISIFHRLETKCQHTAYRSISIFLQSISKVIEEITDFTNSKVNELVKLILKQVLNPTPIELLLSYLSLLLSFGVHNSEILPLLEKITREFDLENKKSVDSIENENTEITVEFFDDVKDLQVEEPQISNLSIVSSKLVQQACIELLNHFEKLPINSFLSFIKLLMTTSNSNFQALIVLILLDTKKNFESIASEFVKNDYLELLLTFNSNMFDQSDQKMVSYHKSIFELINFLSIDLNFKKYSNYKFCSLLKRYIGSPKIETEIIHLSFSCCKQLFNDHSIELIFRIISQNKNAKDETLQPYKKLFLVTIFKIISMKESFKPILNSQFSCDMMISLCLIKPIEDLGLSLINQLINFISEKSNFCFLTNSICNFLLKIKDKDLLIKLVNSLLTIVLIIKDYYEFDHNSIPFGSIGKLICKLNLCDSLYETMQTIVFNNDFIVIPEALPMLLNATENSPKQLELLDYLHKLCIKSIFNQSACIIGSVSPIQNEKSLMSTSFFNLLKEIFHSYCDVNSLRAFFKFFENEDNLLYATVTLIDIIQHSSEVSKPFFQLSSPSSRVSLPSIPLSSFSNGIYIFCNIFIENSALGRNLIEIHDKHLKNYLKISIENKQIAYIYNTADTQIEEKFDLELPIKQWFKIGLLINPNYGFFIFINNEKKIEFKSQMHFDNSDYDFVLFTQKDNNTIQPFLLSSVSVSADFQTNIDSPISQDIIKQYRLYRLAAGNIYEGIASNKTRIHIDNTSLLPVASSFLHSFESTQSIQFILILFKSISNNPLLFDNLIQIIFLLLKKSPVIVQQMIDFKGFAIIGYFLSTFDNNELTVDRWRNLIEEIKLIKNEKLLRDFAHNIFYNTEIILKAPPAVQYRVLFDWNQLGLFADSYQTVPFLLSVYELYTNEMKQVETIDDEIIPNEMEIAKEKTRDRTKSVISCKPCSLPIGDLDDKPPYAHRLSSDTLYVEIESKAASIKLIRNIILNMLKNTISKKKINSKDIRFLYQTIHKCKTSETVLELIELKEFVCNENMEELLTIDNNEWISLFVHPSENVKIKWLSLFASIYPLPSSNIMKSIILMILVNSQGKLRDETSSDSSILAACCKASLCYKMNIDLEKLSNKEILCASPQYFHIALAYSLSVPPKLSNIFRRFFISICKFQDNVKRIAESSTQLTMLILIYWALKRSIYSQIETIEQKKKGVADVKGNKSILLDNEALNCIALICSVNPKLLETAIGVIDSIATVTHFESLAFRSTFLIDVFNIISKRKSKSTIEFIKILVRAIFFHIRIFPNMNLRKMYENSIFSSSNQGKRKRATTMNLPKIRSLLSAYNAIYRSNEHENEIFYTFSLCYGGMNAWFDKTFAMHLIKFINQFYYQSLQQYLSILIYFYCQTQNLNECEALLPIIGKLIKENNNFSFVVIKSLIKFNLFNFDQISFSPRANPKTKHRRHSDLSPMLEEDDNKSDRMEVRKTNRLSSVKGKDRSGKFGLIPKLANLESSPLPNNMTNEFNESIIDSYDFMTIENLGSLIENFLNQNYSTKFFEIVMNTINEFCENRPNYIKNIHLALFSDMHNFSITMQPKKHVNYVNNRFGEKYYQKIYNQIYLPKQNHFKRSSFIDNMMRPILKTSFSLNDTIENIQFEQTNEEYEIRKDFSYTNEFQAQRIKISKIINGTLYVNSTAIKFISNSGKSLKIRIADITNAFPMILLQRQTAVDLFTKQNKSILLNFTSDKDLKLFASSIQLHLLTVDSLNEFTEKWQQHQISTFEYLLILNALSGRSFNTAYSYPIFPWILTDYTSQTLKLDDPAVFRDLSKPLGALNSARLEKLKKLREDNFDGQNFLYRSTYSCAFYIYHYLVRLRPFTSLHVMMQDGKFDVASRLFTSIENSYDRVTGTSFNFRELIPEFFFCPEFLINKDKIPFESDINNVELPPYAKSAVHFIYLNRQALESDYVSSHINEWIDLIWGYKQTGQNAVDNDNVFDPLLYSNVWKEHPDPSEKKQIEELLMHMGQIPLQLFDAPHPKRLIATSPTFSLTNVLLMNTNHDAAIAAINPDSLQVLHTDGRISKSNQQSKRFFFLDGCGCDPFNTMPFKHGFVTNRKNSNAIYFIKDDQQQVIQYRKRHLSVITSVCTVGSRVLTGDMDGIVTSETNSSISIHKSPVVSIAACDILSIVVSMSKNGIIVVSQLHNLKFIRSFKLDHQPGFEPFKVVLCLEFGFICTVSISKDKSTSIITNFTLNGEKIISVHANFRITNIISISKANGIDYLIVSDDKNRVYLFNAFELNILRGLSENEQNITCLALIKKTSIQLCIGFDNGTLKTGMLSI